MPRGSKGQWRLRVCVVCDETYRPTYGAQRTCGRACGGLLNWAEKRGTAIMWPSMPVLWKACEGCGLPYVAYDGRKANRCPRCPIVAAKDQSIDFLCRECGTKFTAQRGTKPRVLCDVCLDEAARAYRRKVKAVRRSREKLARVEAVKPAEIYDRDGYLCRLCSQPLAIDQRVPHPQAPTLDHVVPLARGGEHSRANLQAAHFLCNSLKAAGPS